MLDVGALIEKGLAKAGSEPVVLAAPFDLPNVLVRPFVERGRIAGIVREFREIDPDVEVPVLGQWAGPDRSRLRLSANLPRTMLFLGTIADVGGSILLECSRKGIRNLVHLDGTEGEFVVTNPVRELGARAIPLVLARLGRVRAFARLGDKVLSATTVSFAQGYADLLERASFLRLPDDAFERRSVLMCSGTLGPGGAERQITYCARGIAATGRWRVGVACVDLSPPLNNFHEASIREAGAETCLIPSASEEFRDPRVVELLEYFHDRYRAIGLHHVVRNVLAHAFLFRQRRPGLVHSWMDAANVPAGLAAAIVGVPSLILSGRSMAPDHFSIFQPYMRDGYRAIVKAVSPLILNNSRAGAADYARWLGLAGSQVKVIPNGFEFPDARPEAAAAELRTSLGFERDHVVLGSILRFSEEKRPGLWTEVAARFVRASPNHRAVAFGDGLLRQDLIKQVEQLGLSDRILLPGITRDAWAALACFSLFLLTSRMEGLPNVLIEAQAMGVPVVSMAVGGAPEAFEDGTTGILVHSHQASALADACLRLAADPASLRAMGAAGSRFVRDRFNAERMVQDLIRVYEQANNPLQA